MIERGQTEERKWRERRRQKTNRKKDNEQTEECIQRERTQ